MQEKKKETGKVKTMFPWDIQLHQAVSVDEPAKGLGKGKRLLSSVSSYMIRDKGMVAVTTMLFEILVKKIPCGFYTYSNWSLLLFVVVCIAMGG